MCTRYLSGLILMLALPAWSQDAMPEAARQVSATQAQLQSMEPQANGPTPVKAHTVLRLAGKLLSEHVKGLSIELDPDGSTANRDAAPLAPDANALRLNRRAEICYDNYRLGLRRDGVVMRYELNF